MEFFPHYNDFLESFTPPDVNFPGFLKMVKSKPYFLLPGVIWVLKIAGSIVGTVFSINRPDIDFKLKKLKVMKKVLNLLPLLAITILLTGCPEGVDPLGEARRPQVAILVAEGFHDGEAFMPYGYLVNQGYSVTVIGPEIGPVTAYNSDFTIGIQTTVDNVSPGDFEALIIPGGRAPAALREYPEIVDFVREFHENDGIIAAICHGPQLLAAANVLQGKTVTCVAGISDEMEEAGAEYIDEELVIDENLITSRTPGDLDVFSRAVSESLAEQMERFLEESPERPGMPQYPVP